MVFGHEVRGPLKLLKEQLFQSERETVLQYMSEFKDRLCVRWPGENPESPEPYESSV